MNKLSWYQIIDSYRKSIRSWYEIMNVQMYPSSCRTAEVHTIPAPSVRFSVWSLQLYWSSFARLVYLTHRRFIRHAPVRVICESKVCDQCCFHSCSFVILHQCYVVIRTGVKHAQMYPPSRRTTAFHIVNYILSIDISVSGQSGHYQSPFARFDYCIWYNSLNQ